MSEQLHTESEHEGSYPLLATSMSQHGALRVFRHFGSLNLRSLLFYQAELSRLEQDLERCEKLEATSKLDAIKANLRNWKILTKPPHTEENGDVSSAAAAADEAVQHEHSEHWQIVLRIRAVLEAYYQALQRQKEIQTSFGQVGPSELEEVRSWLVDGRFGHSFLEGSPENVWDPGQGPNKSSAAAFITTTQSTDRITNLVGYWYLVGRVHARSLAHKIRSSRPSAAAASDQVSDIAMTPTSNATTTHRTTDGSTSNTITHTPTPTTQSSIKHPPNQLDPEIYSLSHGTERGIAASILTILTSALLVLPILILYLVHDTAIRLGLVFLFTVMMAAIMSFGLGMNADKVLAISTAFAAVQVVFITTSRA